MAKCSHKPEFAYAWIMMACFVYSDATFLKPANEISLRLKHKSDSSTPASGSLTESSPLCFSYANFHDICWFRQHSPTKLCNYQGRNMLTAQRPPTYFTPQSKFLSRSGRNGLQMTASFQDDPITTRIFCDKTVLGRGGGLSVESALISIRGTHIVEVPLLCLFCHKYGSQIWNHSDKATSAVIISN
jgi:hypothetical protein